MRNIAINFEVAKSYPEKASCIVKGDFNNDGWVDIVSTSSLYLGRKGGKFLKTPFNGKINSYYSVVGDLNSDENLDIISIIYGGKGIYVNIGKGDGSFDVRLDVNFDRPTSIALGDFNKDKILDFAITLCGFPCGVNPGLLQIYYGIGGGEFFHWDEYHVGVLPHGVAVGDFNKDGYVDVAVANSGESSISILLNKGLGDGKLENAVNIRVNEQPYWLATADLDNDGNLDLVNTYRNDGSFSILYGNGRGDFGLPDPVTISIGGEQTSGLLIADVDRNGWQDILIGADELNIFVRDQQSLYTARAFQSHGVAYSILVEDFNHDGVPEIAVSSLNGQQITLLTNRNPFSERVKESKNSLVIGVITSILTPIGMAIFAFLAYRYITKHYCTEETGETNPHEVEMEDMEEESPLRGNESISPSVAHVNAAHSIPSAPPLEEAHTALLHTVNEQDHADLEKRRITEDSNRVLV